eukprot:COSAG04_NODE_4091_length_2304_cov_1210.369112_1_plen_53_part_00
MVTTGKKRGNISKEIPKTPAPPASRPPLLPSWQTPTKNADKQPGQTGEGGEG